MKKESIKPSIKGIDTITNKNGQIYWRARVKLDGKTRSKLSNDLTVACAWLYEQLKGHDGYHLADLNPELCHYMKAFPELKDEIDARMS